MKAYGQEHGFDALVEPKQEIGDESRAWELTSLAVMLTDAQGAYRCPLGDTSFFVTFSGVRLSKNQAMRRPWWRFW